MPELTTKSFLEVAHRDGVVANQSGTHAVYVKSWYSFQSHSPTAQLCVLDILTRAETVLLEDETVTPPVWIGNAHIAWFSGKKTGNTQLLIADINDISGRYVAGVIPGPAHGLRIRDLNSGKYAVVFAAKRNVDGSLHNPEEAPKAASSAQYYTSTMVRLWDTWFTAQRNTVFYALLEANAEDKFALSRISNALVNSKDKLESPIPPFGSKDCYDIAPNGIVFVAKDPHLNTSLHTKCNTYFVPVEDFGKAPGSISEIKADGLEGAALFPVVSSDGKTLMFLKQKTDIRESEQVHIIVVEDFASEAPKVTDVLHEDGARSEWDLSTQSISFLDEKHVIITGDDHGRTCVFVLPIDGTEKKPKRVFSSFSVDTAQGFAMNKIIVSGTSFVDSSIISVVDTASSIEEPGNHNQMISESKGGGVHGFSQDQVSEITWKGVDAECQAWVLKPFGYKSGQKYPVCIWVHGGPQYMEADRWNNFNMDPQPFVAQGYVVILPNVTGSRGYGQDFMNAITVEHGGKPYQDLVRLFDYVKENIEFVDASRAVLGGLSYGGYMTNWIQGNDLGRKFQALFTLNGIYSPHAMMATEELFFMEAEYDGLPWQSEKARKNYDRWDPSRLTERWATPHLIVHTGQDFRCPLENGLAAFNTLQAKGIDSAFLYFEDEPHVISKPENLLVMWNTLLAFCNRHVGLTFTAELPILSR